MPRSKVAAVTADWSDDALLQTVGLFAGTGSDAGLSESNRFRANVSRLVGKRQFLRGQHGASTAPADSPPSLFLLRPGDPPAGFADRCKRVPRLDAGREEIHGRIWFVSHPVNLGHWLEMDYTDDDRLFKFVTDDLDLGAMPAVIFDGRPPGPELSFYPNGLGDPETTEPLHIAHSEISLEELFTTIDVLHRLQLAAPGAQHAGSRLWRDASRGQPVERAEEVLGSLLSAGLQGAFPMCKVRVEQPGATGRLDIEIEEPLLANPGAVMRHAILELKMLRAVSSTGEPVTASTNRKAMKDGVVQAASYRDNRDAKAAALCAFDMHREFSGRECFSKVLSKASELGVELRSWHLFWSSTEWRRHQESTGQLLPRSTPVRS